MQAQRQTPMAVVGIAAQLPSGDFSESDLTYETFWDFLVNKGQAYENIRTSDTSLGNLTNKRVYDDLPTQGAFLKHMLDFDHISLGISKRDAKVMPPAARRLLELSFIAMQDSGIECSGRSIGCFMSGNNDLEAQDMMNAEGSFAYTPSAMANRISYCLNISGPSVFLDTACSSSLTSLHLAINAIENGDCPAALVGACQSNRRLTDWRNYAHSGVLSPDGTCKPFDISADGFSRAEGAAVIVIKPLHRALSDNDHIYSVILGSAINSTGSNVPLNVPNGVSQQQCIRTAYSRAGRDVSECDYLELHATGTAVGDPIEANAAGAILGRSDDLLIGSVKGNLGHLEASAFLVSLAKACLIFKNRAIPPTVNVNSLNPSIHWDTFQLKVAQDLTPLGCRSKVSIISVSSSGIGGSTGHVVLESPPSLSFSSNERWTPSTDQPILCVVGGLSPAAVRHIVEATLELSQENNQSLFDAAVHLCRRARQLPWRTSFMLPSSSAESIPKPVFSPHVAPSLAFVFSGQGPQNLQMGRQLFRDSSIFRASVLELDDIYYQISGASLLKATGLFFSDESPMMQLPSTGWPVAITLPALAILHIALFDLLQSIGVKPDVMLGHSAGETAIIYASGAGSKAMAMEIAVARGRAMTCTEAMDGGMVAMGCSPAQASAFISDIMNAHPSDGILCISCFNAPDSVAITGPNILLQKVITMAQAHGIFAQKIKTLVPGHSAFMDSCRSLYDTQMADIFSRYEGPFIPKIPVYSTCTGLSLVDEFTPEYFWQNARNPVLFSDAVSRILRLPSKHIFVEISPHPVLKSSIIACGAPQDSIICPMQRASSKHTLNEHHALNQALGQLACLGVNSLDLTPLYGYPQNPCHHSLQHPLESRKIPANRIYPTSHHAGLISSPLMLPDLQISRQSHPILAEHIINGESVLPATAFIEILLELGANSLWDINFHSIIPVVPDSPPYINLEREGEVAWSLHSYLPSSDKGSSLRAKKLHASGCMDSAGNPVTQNIDLPSLWKRLVPLNLEGFYESMISFAEFGPHFRRVLRCHGNHLEAIAEVKGLDVEEQEQQYIVHPAILDACLHFMLHNGILGRSDQGIVFMPVKLERFILHRRESVLGSWYSHAILKNWSPEHITYDVTVIDVAGEPICSFKNLTLQKQYLVPLYDAPKSYDYVFQPVSTEVAIPSLVPIFSNDDSRDSQRLNEVLDSIALQLIQNTLMKHPKIGKELHRRRYHEFSVGAVNRQIIPHNSESLEIQALQKRWPAYFTVSERVASVHSSVFESSSFAVNALFLDNLMSEFYGPSNLLKTICDQAATAFEIMILHYLQQGKHFLRVLEVGAGTGMLTRCLINVIQKFQDSIIVEYTVTDISSALASDLMQEMPYEPMVARPYDLSKGLVEQNLSEQTFDIILALHALHVVPDIEPCLQNLHALLVPGGALLAAELDGMSWTETPGSLWLDCIFGSFAEWFGYTDDRTHCAMSPMEWEQKLTRSGFANITTSVESGGGLDFLFVAQRQFQLRCLSASNPKSGDASSVTITYEHGEEIQLQEKLKGFDPTQFLRVQLLALDDTRAGAAIGLISTLGRELPAWEFHLVIFKLVDHYVRHEEILPSLVDIYARGEDVIYIAEDGRPWIPRVVPIPSLDVDAFAVSSFTPGPDRINELDEDLLNVSTVSRTEYFSVIEFVGSIIDPYDLGLKDQPVVGITLNMQSGGQMGETLIAHSGCISPLLTQASPTFGGIIGTALAGLTLGPSLLAHPERAKSPLAILVDLSDSKMLSVMVHIFNSIPKLARATAYNDLSMSSSKRFDIVLSDSVSIHDHPHVRQTLHRLGKFILADEILRSYVKDSSWEIRDALDSVWKFVPLVTGLDGVPLHVTNIPTTPDTLTLTTKHISTLFHPWKTYLLIGGIGGIGLELAMWMYKNGAKHLVLTSRRGMSSFKYNQDDLAATKLEYLSSREDLRLSLESCDATDILAMKKLVRSIPSEYPIGGCFLMPLHLSDALFFNQTEDGMRSVMDSKLKAFETLSAVVDLGSVDFTVTLSSVAGLFGNIGQSNYSSACSAMNWALRPLENSFSVIVPGILDVGYVAQEISDRLDGKELAEWSMTAEALCRCIEDGIKKLREGRRFKQYIPDLKWAAIEKHIGFLPPSCRHLSSMSENSSHNTTNSTFLATDRVPLETVLSLLDVSPAEFDPSLPLATYGLDSITAAKIAAALRPYGSVSQMQLLGGSSWNTLQEALAVPNGHDQNPGNGNGTVQEAVKAAFDIVLKTLDLQVHELDAENPLAAYGLDSISAARLSRALRPYAQVTQMQLLGTTSWADLKKIIERGNGRAAEGKSARGDTASTEAALTIILKALDIQAHELDPENPLAAYGLDSISASRLSRALRPYVQVTQMQLLGVTTWADLAKRIGTRDPEATSRRRLVGSETNSRSELVRSDSPIVELQSGEGAPLIIIHELTGSIEPILALLNNSHLHSSSTVWAVRIISTTPLDSLDALTSFYYTKIKERRPTGPYRFAAFSASSVIGAALVRRFELEAEKRGKQELEVSQLVFIDHFPTFWICRPIHEVLWSTLSQNSERLEATPEAIKLGIQLIVDMLRRDNAQDHRVQADRLRLAEELSTAIESMPSDQMVLDGIYQKIEAFSRLTNMLLLFLGERQDPEGNGRDVKAAESKLINLVEGIRVPMTVIVGSHGMVESVPEDARKEWTDLGASWCINAKSRIKVAHVEGGHFGLFENEEVVRLLEEN